eukprot:COSAG04_NODE_312_length_17133_cov_31.976928_14_plen_100_part_00
MISTAEKSFSFNISAAHNTILFVRRGSIAVSDGGGERQTVGRQAVALMEKEGTSLEITALEPDSCVLLLGGEPIVEPIAARGPFGECSSRLGAASSARR